MTQYITPYDQLGDEAARIQAFLDAKWEADPGIIYDRLTVVSVYNSRTGQMCADAEYWLNEKLNATMLREMERLSNLSPSIAKAYLDTTCKEQRYLVRWCERLNRNTFHQIDAMRTQLSYQISVNFHP